MGYHYLDYLFSPQAIAVFGASDRPDRVGCRVFRNLLGSPLKGKVYPVNPRHNRVQGRKAYARIADIGSPIDLAVVATQAATVDGIVHQCGEHGVRVALILSEGFSETGEGGARLEQTLRETAKRYDLRLVGPNSLGIMRPVTGLNATSVDSPTRSGHLALVSQSGALCTAIVDWAAPHGVGFSAVVSLGNGADVDFGDLLDYLALDPKTRAILLDVESIRRARPFMSGLRAASRIKPVVVLKARRRRAVAQTGGSRAEALSGSDEVFGAALERGGVVRAYDVSQLFAAAELLAGGTRVRGDRLAILTNGGSLGALAADRAEDLGIALADLGEDTITALDQLLPAHWSHGNPVDVLGDAPPERYAEAARLCLADPGVDGLLALLAPQPLTHPTDTAVRLTKVSQDRRDKPVLSCWMGQTRVEEARAFFTAHGIPDFATPERAVEAFSYLARFERNQKLLLQTPPPLSDLRQPDVEGARLIIEKALGGGRTSLTPGETRAVAAAFHIPALPLHETHNASEALIAAEALGLPVALKVDGPQIAHRSDVGGVVLNVASAHEVRSAYSTLIERVGALGPEAEVRSVTVEPMMSPAPGRELQVGAVRDAVFGPAISFGAGGTAVEIFRDTAFALPPLNEILATRLIERTRVASLLRELRGMPAADLGAVVRLLLRVSEMVCELPEIHELTIDPVVARDDGVLALDVRIRVERPAAASGPYAHMAIHPYPSALERHFQLADGTDLLVRPMRPEDAEMEQDFVRRLSPQSKYFRFMQSIRQLSPEMLVRFTQPDYDREMALIAVVKEDETKREVGVARYAINPDGQSCEFALVVSDEWQHRGIGSRLMEQLMEAARERGLKLMVGDVLNENPPMLALCRDLGFDSANSPEDPAVRLVVRHL